MKLAAAEAEKAGVAKEKKVEDQLALARLNVVVDAGLQKWLEAHPVAVLAAEHLRKGYGSRIVVHDVSVEVPAWADKRGAFRIIANRHIELEASAALPLQGQYLFHEQFITSAIALARA